MPPPDTGKRMVITILAPTIAATARFEHAEAVWRGQTYHAKSRNSAICAIARMLLEAGCPDQPWQATRGGKIAMTGRSLATMAGRVYVENDQGIRVRKWEPMPAKTQDNLRNSAPLAA